jgi:hypothetical protein
VPSGREKHDSQIVEIAGRNWLVSQLYLAGVEVARPERDHGIDLIAFFDLDECGRFIACPIQMKATRMKSFDVHRRFGKFPDLLLVYVWGVEDSPVAYCLTYPQAEEIARAMGWTETDSWRTGGRTGRPGYGTRRPSPKLDALLEPYRMTTREHWKKTLIAVAQSDARTAP